MSKSAAMDLVMQFMGRQNSIPIPVPFVRLLGDYAAAAFLAQCLYWTDRGAEGDGWFYKSREEWAGELCLTEKQVRRCMEVCAPYVEIERRGIPARNFYRPRQAEIADALRKLRGQQDLPKRANKSGPKGPNSQAPEGQQVGQEKGQLVTEPTSEPTQNPQQKNTLAADAAARAPHPGEDGPNNAQGGQTSPGPAASPASAEPSPAASGQKVPPAAPVRQTDFARLIATWNEHRGTLPAVQDITEGRKKSIRKLLADCGGDVERAVQVLTDATREVAGDEFWQGRRYGFDNLVPGKVIARAEAWLARHTTTVPERPAAAQVSTSALQVGQRVVFKREAYTVERLTEAAAHLDDPQNGSVTVLRASTDWTAIKPIPGGNP